MRFVKLNYHLIMGVCDTRACPEVGSGAGEACTRRSLLFRVVLAVLIDLAGVCRSSFGLCLLQKNTRTSSSWCHTVPLVSRLLLRPGWAAAPLGCPKAGSPVLQDPCAAAGMSSLSAPRKFLTAPASKFQCFWG